MKNKLLARIAASAISVTMLGTVAFAADPAITQDETSATLSFKTNEDGTDFTINANEDQITMMAYMVDATIDEVETTVENMPDYGATGAGEMIALDQVGGSTGFGEIPVNVAKLTEGKKIAVKLGCTSGKVQKFLIQKTESGVDVLIGDCDGDGIITTDDADLIYYYVAEMYNEIKDWYGIDPTSQEFLTAADTDQDSIITTDDADLIYYYVAEMYNEIYDWYGVKIGEMK